MSFRPAGYSSGEDEDEEFGEFSFGRDIQVLTLNSIYININMYLKMLLFSL